MIAARIARRSLMDRLLLDGMAWTDRHPGLMFAAVGALIVLAGVLEKAFP
ncbi:hypothetical protein [Massilia phosphatilytica]